MWLARLLTVLAFGTLAASQATADVTYAVLFSGGIDNTQNFTRYYDNTRRAWDITTGLFGKNNVWVVFADGTDPGNDQVGGVNSDWSFVPANRIFSATAANLQNVLQNQIQPLTNAEEVPFASFFFYAFDHGGPQVDNDHDAVRLNGWGAEVVTDTQLATWTAGLDVKAQFYDFNECYSHGMADELLVRPNAWVGWAATECSFGDGFSRAVLDAISSGITATNSIGRYAVTNDPFGPTGASCLGGPKLCEDPGYAGFNFDLGTNEAVSEPPALALVAWAFAAMVILRRRRA